MVPSYEQSEKNYQCLFENIKEELISKSNFQKVTRVKILDHLLKEGHINKSYHNNKLKSEIIKDKKDNKYDVLSSLLVSSSILLFFLIVFIPEKDKFTRILFGIYILCIYLIAYLYY